MAWENSFMMGALHSNFSPPVCIIPEIRPSKMYNNTLGWLAGLAGLVGLVGLGGLDGLCDSTPQYYICAPVLFQNHIRAATKSAPTPNLDLFLPQVRIATPPDPASASTLMMFKLHTNINSATLCTPTPHHRGGGGNAFKGVSKGFQGPLTSGF